MTRPPLLQVSATADGRTLLLQVPNIVPGLNLAFLSRVLAYMVEELVTGIKEATGSGATWRPPTLPDTRRIYATAIVAIRSAAELPETEVFEIAISPSGVSSVLLESAKGDVERKLQILSGLVPPSFTRQIARELAWIVKKQEEVVRIVAAKQEAFIRTGRAQLLRPLTIGSVAECMGLHPSTVSRLTRQLVARIRNVEYALGMLIPSDRLDGIVIRTVTREIASDPRYSNGKMWLMTAEALSKELERLTGVRLSARSVSKYLKETGLEPNKGRSTKPPEEEVRRSWRHIFRANACPVGFSVAARQAAELIEEKRRTRLSEATKRLCVRMSDEDFALVSIFISRCGELGFVVDGAKSSLMLKTEPWAPTLAYFYPGRGIEWAQQSVHRLIHDLGQDNKFKDALQVIYSLSDREFDRNLIFVPWSLLTHDKLEQSVRVIASLVGTTRS